MIIKSGTFDVLDLEPVIAIGRFRCVDCLLEIVVETPINPDRSSQGPTKCERCGGLPIVVNETRGLSS